MNFNKFTFCTSTLCCDVFSEGSGLFGSLGRYEINIIIER
jgi:hypothetical protein